MLQNLANGAVTGSVYVLIAVGLTMVYGLLRILHVAHAAVYTLGAFVGLVVWRAGGSLWSALAVAGLVTGAVGVAIYLGVYRPILHRPRLVALIASVGLFVLAESLYQQRLFFGPDRLRFVPESGISALSTPMLRLSSIQVTVLVVTLGLVAGLLLLFRRSRLGLEWRAIATDLPMAEATGIPVRRSMALSFFLGSALAGIGGVLVGAFDQQVYATMGAVPAYKAFVVVVMGGLGSVPGAILAGYLLGMLETLVIAWVGFILPRDAIAFLILILMLMFRPQGLLGRGS